jgi:hypothetical protein
MSYFSKFPRVLYSVNKEGNNAKIVPDMLARVKFIDSVISNQSLFFKYEVKGEETAEQIAHRVYGNPEKHWILFLVNQIIDPHFDWPLGPYDFDKYIRQKYASINVSLSTAESYATPGTYYSSGEVVYQGSSTYDKSTSEATIIAYDSTNKILKLKFPSQMFANGRTLKGVSGNSAAQTHTVIAITNNLDGYQWATNTVSHYEATETKINSDDPTFSEVKKYRVTPNTYNHVTNSIVSINTNTSYSNTYNVVSSATGANVTMTVNTTIGPVTYYDYEVEQNENRRKIIVPQSSIIGAIENQFSALMLAK